MRPTMSFEVPHRRRKAGVFPVPMSACALAGLALALPTAGQAQFPPGAIVQPLPPEEAKDLNSALRRLARNPGDLEALIEAGEASLELDDVDAATGFFSRAQQVSPGNGWVRLGLARVFLKQRRPVEALRLFAEAEQSGVSRLAMASYRALAFDLVGDNASAQQLYRLALGAREDAETRRRLALSLAISGNKPEFEKVLYPLLVENDRAAYRTRAFGLAILGEEEEAVEIAEAVMPTDLALRMAPYLRYMPRLTGAQQAAAANLGVFPAAADIGRDDPSIAGYAAAGARIAARADNSLTPAGEPLGARPRSSAPPTSEPVRRRRPDRASSRADASDPGQPGVDPLNRTLLPAETPTAQPAPALSPNRSQTPPPVAAPSQAVIVAGASLAPSTGLPAGSVPDDQFASVADAFAGLSLAAADAAPREPGAVDITRIEPPREVAQPPEPTHPARHWVQVATGQDLAALAFDWRRIAREAQGGLDGKGPFVTPWGEANRLLAGPYDSAAAAQEKVNELQALGLDSFPFTSGPGEEIAPLD